MNIHELTLKKIADGLNNGDWSAEEVTKAYLEQAEKMKEQTMAYVDIASSMALDLARQSDNRRRAGQVLSKWDGVPVAFKDNIMLADHKATAGSKIIKDYIAPYDATVVTKSKQVGLIPLGKTNCDEFAMGSSTESSCHVPTKNPWDQSRVPGGSSGGSATAVAESSAPVALGTDTGGSIRQPASFCGVVGLKPTYGRVSRYGLMAMASSLDQAGPFTKTVEDSAEMLKIIEGRDVNDSTSIDLTADWRLPETLGESIKGMKIGLPKEYFVSGMDSGVEDNVKKAIADLVELGAEIKEISLPHSEYALAVYYIIMPCEVSANLARFDGIRYGTRVAGSSLDETYIKSRGQGLGKEVRRRIMIGTYALSSGYYDAYYLRAQKVRQLIARDFAKAFTEVDCILTPTSPSTAWKLGEMADDPLAMYLQDIYTVSVNVVGVPAVSIPCGLSDGMPVGLQLIGKHFDEKTILTVANAYEKSKGGFASFVSPVL